MADALDPETLDLAVQYVLGELDAGEARAFERRLDADAALAGEVRRLRATLDLLPYATAADPPPALRARVVAAGAARVRTEPAMPAARRAPRRIVWSQFAAAAAAMIALVVGVDAWRTRRELALERELTTALLQPNVVHSFRLAGAGDAAGAFGTVALDMDAKKGAAVVRNLPVPAGGEVYRLWAQVGDKAVPCGDLRPRADGSVLAQFAVPVESYTAPLAKLFVTREAAPGASAPSGPRVMESI